MRGRNRASLRIERQVLSRGAPFQAHCGATCRSAPEWCQTNIGIDDIEVRTAPSRSETLTPMISLNSGELLARMALAILLGSLIGIERERGERAAGLRTHALVCLGSTVFMLVSAYGLASIAGSTTPSGTFRADPFRIAAQVVSGIGFLGAGMIFFRREIVRGLTTAAGLWVVAALGLAIGAGMYVLSIGATVGALVVLAAFRPLEARLFRRPQRLVLYVHPQPGQLRAIREAFATCEIQLQRLTLRSGEKVRQEAILADYAAAPGADIEQLVELLRGAPGFLSIDQVVLTPESQPSEDEDLNPELQEHLEIPPEPEEQPRSDRPKPKRRR
jgi:putative Mg2+ transporter-C (MgtC) family protein